MTTDTDHALRELDPIDASALRAAFEGSDLAGAMLDRVDLAGTPARPPAPRWRLVTVVGLAAAVLGLTIVPGLRRDTGMAFAVRQLPDGVLEVEVGAEFSDGAALAARLREFGIDVTITGIPASPGAVGQVASFGGPTELGNGFTVSPDGSSPYYWFIDPGVFDGAFAFEVGVEPPDGVAYTFAEEVFDDGEVLDGLPCALGLPMRVDDVVAALPDGQRPVWSVATPLTDDSTQSEIVDTPPQGIVFQGYAIDSSSIRFEVLPDGVAGTPATAPNHEPTCTDEDRARWTG